MKKRQYLVGFSGGLGPDVWDDEMVVEAGNIDQALSGAHSNIKLLGCADYDIFFVEQWDRMDSTQNKVVERVRRALWNAKKRHPDFQTYHHGYAVILEEMDELWGAIKADDYKNAHKECVQVAAVAQRFLIDLEIKIGGGKLP